MFYCAYTEIVPPHNIFFACVVASKGPDDLVVGRLVKLIKDTGLMHFAYRSDKEPSIIALIEEACSRAGRCGVPAKSVEDKVVLEDGDHACGELQPEENPHAIDSAQIGVPEHSHPGESASNGKAERAVQAVVDHIRTLKAAFEDRYNVRLGNSHPLFHWMVEHAAYLLSK